MIIQNKKKIVSVVIILLILAGVAWLIVRNRPKADEAVAGTPEFPAIGAIDIGGDNDFTPSQVIYVAYAGDLYSGSVTSDGDIYFTTIDPGVYNLKIIGTDTDGRAYNYTYDGDSTLVVPRAETTDDISYFDISNLKKGDPAPEFNEIPTTTPSTPTNIPNTPATITFIQPKGNTTIPIPANKKEVQGTVKATITDAQGVKGAWVLSKKGSSTVEQSLCLMQKVVNTANDYQCQIPIKSKGEYNIRIQVDDNSADTIKTTYSNQLKITVK